MKTFNSVWNKTNFILFSTASMFWNVSEKKVNRAAASQRGQAGKKESFWAAAQSHDVLSQNNQISLRLQENRVFSQGRTRGSDGGGGGMTPEENTDLHL